MVQLFRNRYTSFGCIGSQTYEVDKKQTENFRSVLELIRLMDSAMRSMEGCGLAV